MKNIFLATAFLLSYFISSYASTATVGGAGANYATLKAAFDAVNNGTLTGDIELQITGNTTEVNSASLNATGVGNANYNKVLIYPTVAATITGAMNNNLVTLNGADSVTIDGRINQQGANTDLTFTNTNVGTGASTITFQISAKYNVVQYCKLLGATTSNNLGIVSFLNPGATGTGNDYNKISHCEITENTSGMPRIGIYSEGTQGLSGQNNDNNTIEYNKIYNFFQLGFNFAKCRHCSIQLHLEMDNHQQLNLSNCFANRWAT